MKKIIILTGLLFLSRLGAYAQEPKTYADSIAQSKNHHHTPIKVAGIVIPVAMITYGIVSLESPFVQQLDYSTRNELLEDRSMWYNGWDTATG